MSFLDKVKAQVDIAAEKAQQGMATGQAKLSEVQAKRQSDALLRDLGAAYYAQQRRGGDALDVSGALAKVDAHVRDSGPLDTAPTASAGSTPPAGGSGFGTSGAGSASTDSPTTDPAEPPPATYRLDDV